MNPTALYLLAIRVLASQILKQNLYILLSNF